MIHNGKNELYCEVCGHQFQNGHVYYENANTIVCADCLESHDA